MKEIALTCGIASCCLTTSQCQKSFEKAAEQNQIERRIVNPHTRTKWKCRHFRCRFRTFEQRFSMLQPGRKPDRKGRVIIQKRKLNRASCKAENEISTSDQFHWFQLKQRRLFLLVHDPRHEWNVRRCSEMTNLREEHHNAKLRVE